MCGRFTIAKTKEQVLSFLKENFNITNFDNLSLPRYNISPSQPLITLINSKANFKAGLINWDYKIKYKNKLKQVINSRSETINKLYSFKDAFKHKRCLILADSFYEWDRTSKQPYRFLLNDESLYFYAGIYDSYQKDSKKHYGALIITTKANDLVKEHHLRMPVILDTATAKKYLDYSLELEEVKALLNPYPSELMKSYPVSKAVNNPKNDRLEIIKKTTKN
ncbi:MAG: SOS response-associated peptidase [Bacillota bacterium]